MKEPFGASEALLYTHIAHLSGSVICDKLALAGLEAKNDMK